MVMEAAVGKAFEHKDKSVGESGYSHDGRYRIANEARMKNPETREWMDYIIYSNVDNGSLYVREKDDFFEKFIEVVEPKNNNPLQTQVGGTHYKDLKIQPIEFIHANNIPFCEANAIKYLCRWRNKNGKQDLLKARHYIDLLIELEYGETHE
jgi:hypothetical protein